MNDGDDRRESKQFNGVINIDIKDSVPDWEPYAQPVPPEGAPNVLYVVQGHEHPWLLGDALDGDDASWIAGRPPAAGRYAARTRYRQADAACTLGMSETAVKVAIHRLRVRFRELIRAEVASTVNDPADAADELRHLIAIASRGAAE